jgi:hypothetical protein
VYAHRWLDDESGEPTQPEQPQQRARLEQPA